MKKVVLILTVQVFSIFFIYTIAPKKLMNVKDRKTNDSLLIEQKKIIKNNESLLRIHHTYSIQLDTLTNRIKESKIYADGKLPKYYLRFSFTPSTLRLSNIAINSFNIDINVDKRLYDSHRVNESFGRMSISKKWFTE